MEEPPLHDVHALWICVHHRTVHSSIALSQKRHICVRWLHLVEGVHLEHVIGTKLFDQQLVILGAQVYKVRVGWLQ